MWVKYSSQFTMIKTLTSQLNYGIVDKNTVSDKKKKENQSQVAINPTKNSSNFNSNYKNNVKLFIQPYNGIVTSFVFSE